MDRAVYYENKFRKNRSTHMLGLGLNYAPPCSKECRETKIAHNQKGRMYPYSFYSPHACVYETKAND
jgi:hypothetical protein